MLQFCLVTLNFFFFLLFFVIGTFLSSSLIRDQINAISHLKCFLSRDFEVTYSICSSYLFFYAIAGLKSVFLFINTNNIYCQNISYLFFITAINIVNARIYLIDEKTYRSIYIYMCVRLLKNVLLYVESQYHQAVNSHDYFYY